MPAWSVLWLLTLPWVNSWCTVECASPKGYRQSTKIGIILSQEATREYFLEKLKGATKKRTENIPLVHDVPTPLAMLKSGIRGRVAVNFVASSYSTQNRTYSKQPKAYKRSQLVAFGRVMYAGGLEQRTANGDIVSWRISTSVKEQDVMQSNAGVKHLVERRTKKGESQKRRYIVRTSLFLNERDATHAFFYWDPIDGFIGLAFNELQDRATMYQAHWNTIDMFSRKRPPPHEYEICNKCFRREVNQPMDSFINKLCASPYLSPNPSLPDQISQRQSNASDFDIP